MRNGLEATMARGRAAGVTQLSAKSIHPDGRLVRVADGRDILSFATCSYLGLDRDPRLSAGAVEAIERCGVSFSASRCFVTHPYYAEADALLAELFGRPVVLAGSTTLAHGAALPILLERKDVVLFDCQVHHSVQTALMALGPRGPKCEPVAHSDLNALEAAVRAATATGAKRVWYCADGVYSMFGDQLPVGGLAELMARYPQMHAYLDDAHGMSWCGTRGGGSLVDGPLPWERTVLVTSLSKGFGCAGGAIVVPDVLTKHRIENLGPSLMFSIQLPPPMLGAVVASARLHLGKELPAMQRELAGRLALVDALLRADPALLTRMPMRPAKPSPIVYVVLGDAADAIDAGRRMLARGILVNPVAFPAVPLKAGGVRLTITRSHTDDDMRTIVGALSDIVREDATVGRNASSQPGAIVEVASADSG